MLLFVLFYVLWLVVVAVELLIFMFVNKLLAGTSDPTGMIYPAGYGSGENSPPITGMGILTVPIFYGGDGSRMTIPDGDLAIANPYSVTTIHLSLSTTSMREMESVKLSLQAHMIERSRRWQYNWID